MDNPGRADEESGRAPCVAVGADVGSLSFSGISPIVTPVDRVLSWKACMCAMERDWDEIALRRTRTLLAGWSEAMTEMRCQHDRLVSDGLWLTGPSDFLKIVGLARHENTHSRMLEWLLNPTGRHGLGCEFVERLIERCTGEPVSVPPAVRKVVFSEWRNDREADLVVWGEDFTLVIENKIDALEQPSQCDDLYENFKNEKAPLFMFLTPDGRKPHTATTPCSQRAFKTLSWPGVRAMFEEALAKSQSATEVGSASDVVTNYLRTLKEQFG